ncbi:hypothetical protein FOG82_01500 [Limosilactobacillus reuteri]|nr:hypothetical protein FOG82_01500 [Limosilactobacillus reuteri]UAW61558.1 GntP family permease [Limosilactobacillus reuteri]
MTLLQQNFVTAKPINFYYLVCKLDRVQYQLKMNTFVGLVITSFIVGLLLGLPLTKIPQTIETGYT